MTWSGPNVTETVTKLIADLTTYTQPSRVINSAYGNPYMCTFGTPRLVSASGTWSKGVITLVSEGSSYRL